MSYNQISLPYEVSKLENTEIITTNKNNDYTEYEDIPFIFIDDYLYHGIRNQYYLEKLENIFKEKKILAGKYIKNYLNYSDNCNKGEYVSLLKIQNTSKICYETFIEENISLLITPFCNAIETKYVNYYTWEKIKNLKLIHIYSYLPGECMCKDYIPIKYIKAIGVPYKRLVQTRNKEYVDNLLKDIETLMKKYDIYLPIVDTSNYNQLLTPSSNKQKTNNNYNLVRKKYNK